MIYKQNREESLLRNGTTTWNHKTLCLMTSIVTVLMNGCQREKPVAIASDESFSIELSDHRGNIVSEPPKDDQAVFGDKDKTEENQKGPTNSIPTADLASQITIKPNTEEIRRSLRTYNGPINQDVTVDIPRALATIERSLRLHKAPPKELPKSTQFAMAIFNYLYDKTSTISENENGSSEHWTNELYSISITISKLNQIITQIEKHLYSTNELDLNDLATNQNDITKTNTAFQIAIRNLNNAEALAELEELQAAFQATLTPIPVYVTATLKRSDTPDIPLRVPNYRSPQLMTASLETQEIDLLLACSRQQTLLTQQREALLTSSAGLRVSALHKCHERLKTLTISSDSMTELKNNLLELQHRIKSLQNRVPTAESDASNLTGQLITVLNTLNTINTETRLEIDQLSQTVAGQRQIAEKISALVNLTQKIQELNANLKDNTQALKKSQLASPLSRHINKQALNLLDGLLRETATDKKNIAANKNVTIESEEKGTDTTKKATRGRLPETRALQTKETRIGEERPELTPDGKNSDRSPDRSKAAGVDLYHAAREAQMLYQILVTNSKIYTYAESLTIAPAFPAYNDKGEFSKATISLPDYNLRRKDSVRIAAGTSPDGDNSSLQVEIDKLGFSMRQGAGVLLVYMQDIKDSNGTNNVGYVPAAAAKVDFFYRAWGDSGFKRSWNALSPSVGLDVVALPVNNRLDFGLGGHVGIFDGLLVAGWGRNITDLKQDEGFIFIGLDLVRSFHVVTD